MQIWYMHNVFTGWGFRGCCGLSDMQRFRRREDEAADAEGDPNWLAGAADLPEDDEVQPSLHVLCVETITVLFNRSI